MPEGGSTITVHLPTDLRERARKAAKRLRSSTGQLIRDGLTVRVESIEDKFKREEAERELEKSQKKTVKGAKFTARPLDVDLPKVAPAPAPPAAPLPPLRTKLDGVYENHAREILLAGEDREEIKRIVIIAIRNVHRESPLTHPPDTVIVANLEREVLRLREQAPVTEGRSYDDAVGVLIDSATKPKAV